MTNSPLVRAVYLVLPLLLAGHVNAADPTVSNVRATQKTGTKQVEIYYDLSGTSSPLFVSLQISSNGGTTFAVPATTLSGHVGAGVALGQNRKITWNAGADWNNQLSNTVKFRITASGLAPPGQMVLIPGGTFQMGDNFNEGWSDERPVHSMTLSAFYLQNTEVTKAQWDAVRDWGAADGRGYTDLRVGGGKAANHPVHGVSWWDVVKWCNARSERENLTAVYRNVDGSVFKTGTTVPIPNWSANGYRLPTEAEWEKAARGGLSGKRFPWGDTITHSQANFWNSGGESYQSGTTGPHPAYNDGVTPYTSPVGSFAPNGYGLYDMAGNLWEWCWDWYSSSYYSSSPGTNPRGPVSGTFRGFRGGSWGNDAFDCRAADRRYSDPGGSGNGVGFRPARSSVP